MSLKLVEEKVSLCDRFKVGIIKNIQKMITRKKVFAILILSLLNVEYGMSRALDRSIDFQDCGKRL